MITAHYALIRCPKGFVGSKTPLRARQTLWFESPILGVFYYIIAEAIFLWCSFPQRSEASCAQEM